MAANRQSGEYWIISVPNEGRDAETVHRTQRQYLQKYCSVTPFQMPPLRVSAVDELMKLNELLTKYDVFAGSVVTKVARSYQEFSENDILPTVDDRSIYKYIPEFVWEKGRNPFTAKLSQISQDIHERFVTTNERLKTMAEKYKQVKQKLTSDQRASEGNLMVCDIQKYVQASDYVTGEYITTMMVVVPKQKKAMFEQHYWCLDQTDEAANIWRREEKVRLQMEEKDRREQEIAEQEEQEEGTEEVKPVAKRSRKAPAKEMAMPQEERDKLEVVCPNSAELLVEEGDFCLYRVVVLKRGVKWFKQICRELRYTVRDFVYKSEEEQGQDEQSRKMLKKDAQDKKKRLVAFCQHSFRDVVEDWLHMKIIRVFVEAVLRYGPPSANLVTTILSVNPGRGAQLNNQLTEMYKHLTSSEMLQSSGDDEAMAMMGTFDLRPYVFIPVMANFE